MATIDPDAVREIVSRALDEDVGPGDITTRGVIPESTTCHADFISGQVCVLAGMPVVETVFALLDNSVNVKPCVPEGADAHKGQVVAVVEGPARAVLIGERVALNLLRRLSGIATITRQFVEKARLHGVLIKDTRKTTPGLRALERYAVEVGGGVNHRIGLYDAVMIKDNHLKLMGDRNLRETVRDLRAANPGVAIEIEAETLREVENAVAAAADIVMLDNMTAGQMRKAVAAVRNAGKGTILEASGGMTLKRIADVAATGVDWISVGALTANPPAIDIKMEVRQ
jgi:nicotinate-nucleotide pyrophosphorylase (carboxylating)